ncbi:MAG: type 3 dihydrofolate reductase [Methylococcales symbiont of Hymedesmia sp. n. MRB-2018]|nr:MAG: type 3 dihydrofolate reductase [Methylococcales symbiont of Hymedesmia sp. n. MRB-2018]KAF3983385.1 MAG: type 3 dihydrofolate reductase [Methylococcales symbiont of Hymedesmia sp. n. MRB-2018]
MKLSIIVAMASNRAIGLNNKMPWHLSADLKKFKAITMGSPVLMGRKTYESIGRPLPGRTNIIISRNPDYQVESCLVFNTVDKAIEACQQYDEIFVIGGATLYQLMLPKADLLYLTQINKRFEADTCFPDFNKKEWNEIAREEIEGDESVDFSYSFITLERNSAA